MPIDFLVRVWEGAGLLLVGLVVVTLAPQGSREVAQAVLRRFPLSILTGFILLVVVPLVALALAITLIGIPLAVAVMLLLAAVVYPSQMFVAGSHRGGRPFAAWRRESWPVFIPPDVCPRKHDLA